MRGASQTTRICALALLVWTGLAQASGFERGRAIDDLGTRK